MTIFPLPASIRFPLQSVSHLFSNTPLLGDASFTNSTQSMASNTAVNSQVPTHKLIANILPGFRDAAVGFVGACAAELTVHIPENVARCIIGATNLFSCLQKAYALVHKWPEFRTASNADKVKILITEAAPIIAGLAATLLMGAPGRMVGYIFFSPALNWVLNHFSPNATDTRELTVTTSWQVAHKLSGYTFGFVIIPAPSGLPLIFVVPFRKAASELFYRSLETLNQWRNKQLIDDPKKITIPTLSLTHGNFAYETATLLSFTLASANANNLIFMCETWSKPAGVFAPVFNNMSGALANAFNGTIAPSLYGAMSEILHLEPKSKTITAQGTTTISYQPGNKRNIIEVSSYAVDQEDVVAATLSPEAINLPIFLDESEPQATHAIFYIDV